jgi:phosphatidylserine decarboxylase
MLTKYGLDNILVMLSIGIGLIVFSFFFQVNILKYIFIILGLLLILFTFIFFRDPDRTIPEEAQNNPRIILSPADGKVTEIIEIYENDYIKEYTKRISIFLSPLDVHVNRSPVSGIVEYLDYIPGKFLAAYNYKASEQNEQSKIGVKNDYGKVLFKQIVGVLARRIVTDLIIGQEIKAGDKIGMMKFGSRMDISLPINTEITIKVGDRVVAGETIIAKLK